MTLLFITQKLHGQDAFGVLWIRAFMERGYTVKVIVLEKRLEDAKRVLGDTGLINFDVYSMGKEEGVGKVGQILRFWKLIRTLEYDRVFIHMSPVWGLFGAWYWMLFRRVPVYLWYTHYKMQAGLWLLGHYAKRLFCATPQSLPQYEGSAKKVVVGHGIDLSYWPKRPNRATDHRRLLVVHRLCRSKRLEIVIGAMKLLPAYSLEIYGIEAEPDYVREMKALIETLGLSQRVIFKGSAPSKDLPAIYAQHRLILNMASETIDKTMLEAMTCGCYPVTTARNAAAIGIPFAPSDDSPEALARFIEQHANHAPVSADEMYRIVEERHSLKSLIEKMDRYIQSGD